MAAVPPWKAAIGPLRPRPFGQSVRQETGWRLLKLNPATHIAAVMGVLRQSAFASNIANPFVLFRQQSAEASRHCYDPGKAGLARPPRNALFTAPEDGAEPGMNLLGQTQRIVSLAMRIGPGFRSEHQQLAAWRRHAFAPVPCLLLPDAALLCA